MVVVLQEWRDADADLQRLCAGQARLRRRAPIEALSVMEVKGYGRQKSYLDEYQETEYSQAFVPKVEITLWVDDSRCDEILEKIVGVARSGRIGDGKIFVLPVAEFF